MWLILVGGVGMVVGGRLVFVEVIFIGFEVMVVVD